MRILLVTPYFYPHSGGSQQYALELHRVLKKTKKDIQIDVVCCNTKHVSSFEKYQGLNIYRMPTLEILKDRFALANPLILIATLVKLFSSHKYDIINSHTRFFDNSWWIPLLGKITNTKTLLTDHCADHPTHPNPVITSFSKLVDQTISVFFAKQFSAISVTNLHTKKFLHSLGITNTTLIYGGVDTTVFKPQKKTPNTIFFVGRGIKSKGPDLLYQALLKIKTPFKAYFIGTGDIISQLSKINKNPNIFFLGHKNKSEIATFLSSADILVHPSTHNEGLPNVLLEAISSGCATISTNMGGSNEVILDKKTGLIARPSVSDLVTKINLLVTDPSLKQSLQKQARVYSIKNYDWVKIANQYYNFLKKTI